jgi:hypothetical protein
MNEELPASVKLIGPILAGLEDSKSSKSGFNNQMINN